MLVLNKKSKTILAVMIFIVLVFGGLVIEHFEKDAFIKETVATEDTLAYKSDAEQEINGLININSADVAELEKLKGIGEAMANRIIKYREENGPFVTIEEIMKVSGINESRFGDIKDFICAE